MTASTKPSAQIRAVHSGSLDGLRGILALIVCLDHAWSMFIHPVEGLAHRSDFEAFLFFAARMSVLCFFALSGFVMAMSVKKSIVRNDRFSLWSYSRSRLVRILPPLLLIFLMGWMLEYILTLMNLVVFPRSDMHMNRPNFRFDISSQLWALFSFGLHGDLTGGINGPLWSLRFEIQCYVLCGLGSYIAFSKAAWWKRVAVLFLLHYFAHRLHLILSLQTICYTTFFFGWLVYWNQHRLTWKVVGAVVLMFAMVWFTALRLTNFRILDPFADLDQNNWMLLNQMGAGALGALALVAIQRSPWVARFKSLGDFSYTLYIAHFPILLFGAFLLYSRFRHVSLGAGVVIGLGMICLCLVVSLLLAIIGERPAAARYKDNFITQIWDKWSPRKTETS